MSTFEILQLVFLAVTALAVIGGAFYGGMQLRLLKQSNIDSLEWNRRKAAQDATLLFRTRVGTTKDLDQAFSYIDRSDAIPLAELNEKFGNNPELRTKLHRLLNYYESLSRGVETEIYDETIVKTAWDGSMIRAVYKFREYIESRRISSSPDAWSQLCQRQHKGDPLGGKSSNIKLTHLQ